MGCSNSHEIPLQAIAGKRSIVLNLSLSDTSSDSTPKQCDTSFKKLALRMLVRYANLIIFRSVYCCFRQWKKHKISKLSLSEISIRNVSFTDDTFNLLIVHTPNRETEESIIFFSGELPERSSYEPIFKPSIDILEKTSQKSGEMKKQAMKKFTFLYCLREKIVVGPEELTVKSELKGVNFVAMRNYEWLKALLVRFIAIPRFSSEIICYPIITQELLNKIIIEPESLRFCDGKLELSNSYSPDSPTLCQSIESEVYSNAVTAIRKKHLIEPLSLYQYEIRTKTSISPSSLKSESLHSSTNKDLKHSLISRTAYIPNSSNRNSLLTSSMQAYCTKHIIDSRPSISNTLTMLAQKHLIEPLSLYQYEIQTKQRISPESLELETPIPIYFSPKKPPKHPILSKSTFESTPGNKIHSKKLNFHSFSPKHIINFKPAIPEVSETLISSYKKKTDTLSPLLSTLSTERSNESPFSIPQILKIFEEVMDQKYALDQKELNDQIKPRELAEFFPDYLNRNFGIQKVGQRMLNKLLQSLQTYSSHPYINLFSRFLRIQCENPISLNLLIFLSKARMDFNSLIQKKNNALKKSGKNSKESKNFKELGGSATLLSVFSYISKEFKDPEVFKYIIVKICPQYLKFEEFCLFFVMSRIVKQGINLNDFNCQEAARLTFDIIGNFLNNEQKMNLNSFIMNQENKVVQNFFNFKAYKDKIMNEKYWVSKYEFLKALIEVYEFFKYKTLVFIADVLQDYHGINKDEFFEAVKEVDPGFSEAFIEKLYQEAVQIDKDENISPSTFSFLMIQYAVGYLSCFRNYYTDLKTFNEAFKSRRVDYADLCIKPSDAFDLRSSLHRSKTLSTSTINN